MEKCLEQALKDLYNKEVDLNKVPDLSLWEGFHKTFNHAVIQSFPPTKDKKLSAHFEMGAQMVDKEGNLKSFDQFRKDVEPIADHHVRQWLRTEYDMALSRAHLAADWATYEKDRDIMPNLRWVESTAVTPDAVHSSFWGMVRPVDDAFWAAHHPGDHWGCQCSLEQTDDPVTPLSDEVIRKAPLTIVLTSPDHVRHALSGTYSRSHARRKTATTARQQKSLFKTPTLITRRSSLNTTVILSNDMQMWKRISRTIRRSLMLARRSPEKDAHLLLPRSLTGVQ